MPEPNWDKWQEQVDEHNPNCPWLDDEDEQEYDPYFKADEEED